MSFFFYVFFDDLSLEVFLPIFQFDFYYAIIGIIYISWI